MALYVVNKPLGLTSFDVVARARRHLGTKRIGHSGTLDPLATGVLVLLSETSTRLVPYLQGEKEYLAFVSLGASTPTLDAEGPISTMAAATLPDTITLERALERLRGHLAQIPPAFSAIHVDGRRAYSRARAGETLELSARSIVVHELECIARFDSMQEAQLARFAARDGWTPSQEGELFTTPEPLGKFPTLVLRARVSSGTYLRSLARDLGEHLGVPAHLAGLVRTRVGQLQLSDATSFDEFRALGELEALDLPRLEADEQTIQAVRQGRRVPSSLLGLVVLVANSEIIAICTGDGNELRAQRVWPIPQ